MAPNTGLRAGVFTFVKHCGDWATTHPIIMFLMTFQIYQTICHSISQVEIDVNLSMLNALSQDTLFCNVLLEYWHAICVSCFVICGISTCRLFSGRVYFWENFYRGGGDFILTGGKPHPKKITKCRWRKNKSGFTPQNILNNVAGTVPEHNRSVVIKHRM